MKIGPAPTGNAIDVAAMVIRDADHSCGTVVRAIRLETGGIRATCSNGEAHRVFTDGGDEMLGSGQAGRLRMLIPFVLVLLLLPDLALAEPRLPYSSECTRWLDEQSKSLLTLGPRAPRSRTDPPKDCGPIREPVRLPTVSPSAKPAPPPPRSPAGLPSTSKQQPSVTIYGPQPGREPLEPMRPERPIAESEVDANVKAILERAGEPGVKCQKKQYGGGWVTICE
jgi:hypothetical protein